MDDIAKVKYLAKDFSVLVVEDSKILQKNVVTLVSKFFKTVHTADDGRDGLSKYLEYEPDIVFCDLLMPKLDGYEMIEQIMHINPAVKVIVISAHTDQESLLRTFHLGVSDFIPKPINLDLLMHALVRVLSVLKKDFSKIQSDASTLGLDQKFDEELNVLKNQNIKVNLINHYKGVPIIHEAHIIEFHPHGIELRTQDIQNFVINAEEKTLIDSELLTKDIDAQLDYIDEKTQNIILKNPTYVDFSIKHRAEVRVQPDENFKFIINDAHGKIETKVIDCSVKAISVEIAHLPKDFEQNKKIAVSIGFEMKHSKTFDIRNRDYIGTYATVFKILQDNGTNKLILNFELKKSDEELLGKYIYQRQIELVQELKHLIKN